MRGAKSTDGVRSRRTGCEVDGRGAERTDEVRSGRTRCGADGRGAERTYEVRSHGTGRGADIRGAESRYGARGRAGPSRGCATPTSAPLSRAVPAADWGDGAPRAAN